MRCRAEVRGLPFGMLRVHPGVGQKSEIDGLRSPGCDSMYKEWILCSGSILNMLKGSKVKSGSKVAEVDLRHQCFAEIAQR
jgi:hypothetical protein